MSLTPYYADDSVTLYCGRIEDVLPEIREEVDLMMADPPYGETSLDWDRWPDGWPSLAAQSAASLWCFGSMRMFLDRRSEFAAWRLSQDVIWEKHNGSGMAGDRFRRTHEHVTHWCQGDWSTLYHETPRMGEPRRGQRISRGATPHLASPGQRGVISGQRLATSVLYAPSMHGSAINETEKPTGILEPLISYGCPPGGLILDLFAGSCSASVAARALGRRSIAIEMREKQCERAARRLAQDVLPLEAAP